MNIQKDVIIYNQYFAAKLMAMGYKLLRMKENSNNTDFNVFYFKHSDKIMQDIEHIKKEKTQNGMDNIKRK